MKKDNRMLSKVATHILHRMIVSETKQLYGIELRPEDVCFKSSKKGDTRISVNGTITVSPYEKATLQRDDIFLYFASPPHLHPALAALSHTSVPVPLSKKALSLPVKSFTARGNAALIFLTKSWSNTFLHPLS